MDSTDATRPSVLVIGEALVREESRDEALALSRAHVERSRAEPGCLSHDVHHHVDEPARLVFVERWADRAALDAHFAVPESAAFARALTALTTRTPRVDVYDVRP